MHWITREHAAERVGVEGFLACRIFRALGTRPTATSFSTSSKDAGVVGGPQYLARLNAPTPWSQRTMPRLQNFARGGGRVVASAGMARAACWPCCGSRQAGMGCRRLAAELAGLDRSPRRAFCSPTRPRPRSRPVRRACENDDPSPAAADRGLDEAAVRNALWHLRASQNSSPPRSTRCRVSAVLQPAEAAASGLEITPPAGPSVRG